MIAKIALDLIGEDELRESSAISDAISGIPVATPGIDLSQVTEIVERQIDELVIPTAALPENLTLRSLTIVDRDGDVVGEFGSLDDVAFIELLGQSSITFYDEQGQISIDLGRRTGSPTLLFGTLDAPNVNLHGGADGGFITLSDGFGNIGAMLSSRFGQPVLLLFDQNDVRRSAFAVRASGQPEIVLYDANGNTRALLGVLGSSGVGQIQFFHASGEVVDFFP